MDDKLHEGIRLESSTGLRYSGALLHKEALCQQPNIYVSSCPDSSNATDFHSQILNRAIHAGRMLRKR